MNNQRQLIISNPSPRNSSYAIFIRNVNVQQKQIQFQQYLQLQNVLHLLFQTTRNTSNTNVRLKYKVTKTYVYS